MLDNISLGLWVDDSPHTVLKPSYIAALEEMKIDLLAVMIDDSRRRWRKTWSTNSLERLLKAVDPLGIEVVLTTWPYPDKTQINEMAESMKELLSIGPVSGWESDLEFNWRNSKVREFRGRKVKGGVRKSALDVAGDYFVNVAREVCGDVEARFEVTSFTQHTENGPKADVVPHCDRFLVQAYSVRTRPSSKLRKIPWDHLYGPGRMQSFTLDRSLLIPEVRERKVELGVGLAAWSQKWPKHDAYEAMREALDESLLYDEIVDIRYWSSKHVIGVKKNVYAYNFLKSLRSGL